MPTTPEAVPIQIGPLTGEARISGEGRALQVAWILHNPTREAIRWPSPDEPIPPGGTLQGTLQPFLERRPEVPVGEDLEQDSEQSRWRSVQESRWPVSAEEGDFPGPRAWLHVAWRKDTGVNVWLASEREGAEPFHGEASLTATAARRLGTGWVLARVARGAPATVKVLIAPEGEQAFWHDRDTTSSGDFRWSNTDRRVLQPWLPPSGDAAGPPHAVDARWWTITEPTGLDGPVYGSQLKLAWPAGSYPNRTPYLSWECERWVMVPRSTLPTHDRDFELARLRITWDPDGGLELEVGERRPR